MKNFFKSLVMYAVIAFAAIGKFFMPAFKPMFGMAALTETKVIDTEFAGDYKTLIKTVVPSSNTDTLTLVRATDKVTEIAQVFAEIQSGSDANLLTVEATFSGLVITLKTYDAAGSVATDWTGAVIKLLIFAR